MKTSLLLATHNDGKVREFARLLPDFALTGARALKLAAPEETGQTFIENALIKARAGAQASGLPTLADDSGLIVPSLGGAPGVYSSRYAGPEATDRDNWQALLKALDGNEDRRAAFYCVLVLMSHPEDPCPRIAEGLWPGEIALAPEGEGGFGYDPVFWVRSHGCTAARLAPEEKAAQSHRGRAVTALKAQLAERPLTT
ncbi:MAG: RdgB/HAM1 family non-canonical purine NTP pyrophosphatase [Gammaproteobacteria bacterium]|jgi:XTP/dITP diphosphohydrolase|nr:RdgB/HAM1 family non-canonical purine NTP pyrophosphatase [Gammaproteobacteria bacterium]